MAIVKRIEDNSGSGKTFESVTTSQIVYDTTPQLGSFNPVTSDGVAKALAGASGEVPVVNPGDAGKVLTAGFDGDTPTVSWEEPQGTEYTAGDGISIDGNNVISCTVQSPTAGDGIAISDSGVVGVNRGNGLIFYYNAEQYGSQVGDAFKYHVGHISGDGADIGFYINISAPQFGDFYSPDVPPGNYLAVVAANPSDTSIYAIGPVITNPFWEDADGINGVYGAVIHTGGASLSFSGTINVHFGNAFRNCVDSNGDILLYLCGTIDSTRLNGSGNGPGGSACASIMWGPYDNTRPYFRITLGGELAGPGALSVAEPVPSTAGVPNSAVLAMGNSGMEWVEGGVPSYMDITSGTVSIARDNTVVTSTADMTSIIVGANVKSAVVQWTVASTTALPTVTDGTNALKAAVNNPSSLTVGRTVQVSILNGTWVCAEFA